MNNLEKKKARYLKNYLKNKVRIYLDRKINHDKYIAYWRNYSKENREHRRILEKQSTLRFKQTKKYLIPKLIRTLKKIIRIKKTQEVKTRRIMRELFKPKKPILYKLMSVLRKIKRKKHQQNLLKAKEERQSKKLQKKKEILFYLKHLQSQLKRPIKKVIGDFRQKLLLTYGKTQTQNRNPNYRFSNKKLHEYLLWYINTPKICGYCGIPEGLLATKLWFNKKSPYLEIDRKDPNENYEFDNIHLACSICNSTKLHIFSYEEMKEIGIKFILPKWHNSHTPENNKKFKITHHAESLKNKANHPKEYQIWIKLKKRSRRIGKKLPYLSFEDFLSWYKTQDKKCTYCGISETLLDLPKIKLIFSWCSDRLTIDRIVPTEGYSSKNIVLSCLACNTIKSNVFTFDEMKEIGSLLRKKWQNLIKGGLNV